jgi:hypothetical protein
VTTSFFPMPYIVRHCQSRSTGEPTDRPEVTQW